MPKKVVSLGYERRSVPELLGVLKNNDVHKLLDVRELPLSRRKGFSKTKLSQELEEAGITYVHVRDAGNPHRKLKADIDVCLSKYEDYLSHHMYVLELIETELGPDPVAILCYERDHSHCHRSVLIEFMKKRNKSLRIVEI